MKNFLSDQNKLKDYDTQESVHITPGVFSDMGIPAQTSNLTIILLYRQTDVAIHQRARLAGVYASKTVYSPVF